MLPVGQRISRSFNAAPSPLLYFYCFCWCHLPELARGAGMPERCVRSVSSHMSSNSHLPPYSSQPDPYPQSSLAQETCFLIPTKKRFPAGGCGGAVCGELRYTKVGGSWVTPHSGPLTWSLVWQGQTGPDTQHCVYSLPPPPPPPLLSAIQTPEADGEAEKGEENETEQRGWANEHNEDTDTDYPDPLLLLRPPFIFGYRSLFPMGRLLPCPLPCMTPLFPLFLPQQQQPGEPPHSVANHCHKHINAF